ncbi:uncharacterized protein J4E79_008939 [Alternaria viburni]|uniref:uncharacterized protein n=1 Tax=Alternaria viburni TaxID=566460 RepID=UPI0020C54026|nr:uncharacterized protein J4E79_008939 [Alternaria viburni]KAI4652632.1 hypothetical protein J4E79_008939 [Alternaria viburni]
MSPKRKKTGQGDDPNKAKKTRSEDTPEDETATTNVNWFIPKEKGKNIYKEKCATEYAQILYEKAREEISPQQAPLLDPQFRTPVFQKQGKDLRAGDKYRPSASLRNLFNDIKSRSIAKEEGHSLTHFQQQFGDDANIAIVLSRAENNATFILNEDQRLEVPIGYFIHLPLNTSVTVNGTTYTNSDDSSSMPFYIGPLEGAVPQEELDRRDGNGDVALGNTRVRWGPVGAPLPPVGSGNPDVQEEVEEESEDNFIDTFTDEGEPIKDLDAYMRAQLLSHQQSRYRELIPRVLASVNYRQKEATGFSYQHEGQTFRPGRTLLQPIEVEGNNVLLAAQIHADKHITLEVLDPMTWRSTLSSRKAIDELIRETLRSSTWWRHVFDSLDQMEENLPEATMWVPAAQVTTGDGSFTYTVLNAWALAMGLAPSPSFTSSAHGHESFFIRAQQIFDLALQDKLNWRVLLAFFRCTGFVKPSEGSEDDEEANLPHLSRRFDLCNRSFQKLTARQTAADAAAEGKKIDMELVTLGLEDGMRHDQAFAADSLSELERTNLTSIVRDAQWNFADTEEKLKKRLDERKEQKMSDMSLTKTTPPPPPPPHELTPDTEEIPVDFDPCKHLHEQIKLLEEQGKIEPKVGSEIDEALPSRWSQAVFGYIEPVVRAINDLLSPERPQRGFTLADLNGNSRYADDSGVLDTVVMMVCQLREHVILVVLQHEDASKEAPDVSRVMDSAPWIATAKERIQIHNLLIEAGMLAVDPTADKVKSFVGPVLQWMPGPQQAQVIETGYIAIMSAWAVLLGLPINPEFRIGADFYDSALPLLQAVMKAHADWKLIWAFLRCVGYTQSERPPPMQRRFKATRPARGPRITKGNRKTKRSIETQACRDLNYPHFPVNAGVAHTEAFRWDDYDGPDRRARIPELIRSGKYTRQLQTPPADPPTIPAPLSNSLKDPKTGALITTGGHVVAGVVDPPADDNPIPEDLSLFDTVARIPELQRLGTFDERLSREEIRKRYDASAKDFQPCEHLRRTLQNLLANDKVKEEVKTFRSGERVTTEFGKWLSDEEVAMHAAAVTLAINDTQSIEEGYSVVSPATVELCKGVGASVTPALRPGRPLLMPLYSESHFVLVIVQLNEKGLPEISVLDSLFYHYNAFQRNHIFEIAWRVVCRTAWYRRHFPDEATFKNAKPSHATWVKTALQPSTNECGYFVMLNAWGLALGLELNPAVRLKWTKPFFDELYDVISLARLGHADWKLIFALLRCHDIVRNGSVPENRRFTQTHAIQNEDRMVEDLGSLGAIELIYWQERQQPTPEENARMRRCNRVPGLNGSSHSQAGGFPSDEWTGSSKSKFVPRLQQLGILNVNHDSSQLEEAHDGSWGIACERFLNSVPGSIAEMTRDTLIQSLRVHLENHFAEVGKHYKDTFAARVRDVYQTYVLLMQKHDVRQCFGDIGVGVTKSAKHDWKQPLHDSEVNLAIVSVLEAIDNLQSDAHGRTNSSSLFAGGFTLATSASLAFALCSNDSDKNSFDNLVLSRPRRAWLMPLVVSSGGLLDELKNWAKGKGMKWKPPTNSQAEGHTLLVLIQESFNDETDDYPGETHFEIVFIDSCQRIFKDVQGFFLERISKAHKRLKWSDHRRVWDVVPPREIPSDIQVPQQQNGGWQCGHHTVINAWIIALGLHPKGDAIYKENGYNLIYRLAQMATAGLLDWRTLAEFLISKRLTIETSADDVPESRRFKFTCAQTNESALDVRIREYALVDTALGTLPPTDTPYDHDTNFVPIQEEEEEEGLAREFEDMKSDFPENRRNAKRKLRDDGSDGLALWDDVAAGRDGRHVTAADAPRRSKRQRLSNGLSFLDAY